MSEVLILCAVSLCLITTHINPNLVYSPSFHLHTCLQALVYPTNCGALIYTSLLYLEGCVQVHRHAHIWQPSAGAVYKATLPPQGHAGSSPPAGL